MGTYNIITTSYQSIRNLLMYTYRGWTIGEKVILEGKPGTITSLPGCDYYDNYRFSSAREGCLVDDKWVHLKDLQKTDQTVNSYEIY